MCPGSVDTAEALVFRRRACLRLRTRGRQPSPSRRWVERGRGWKVSRVRRARPRPCEVVLKHLGQRVCPVRDMAAPYGASDGQRRDGSTDFVRSSIKGSPLGTCSQERVRAANEAPEKSRVATRCQRYAPTEAAERNVCRGGELAKVTLRLGPEVPAPHGMRVGVSRDIGRPSLKAES